MDTSKLKLVFIWALFIIGTYIFWILSYFVLVKFALGEINELKYTAGSIYQVISLSNLFWYLLYLGGIALSMFAIKQLVVRAPNPKIAAAVYAVLIAVSATVLIKELASKVNILHILPHIIVNLCFLIVIVVTYIKFNSATKRLQQEG